MPDPGFRIKTIHAFTVIGDDDEEGIPAFEGPGGVMYPLIAANPARLEQLRPVAERTARQTGKKVTLARFSVREDLEEIEP